MGRSFTNAVIAALMAGIIIAPVFGFKLVREGAQTVIEADWGIMALGMGIVFMFHLVRPQLAKLFGKKGGGRSWSMPVLSEPARRGTIFLLIALALLWPFFSGRANIDLATLVLIYVMLGLGLNIVVGFAGLLDLGFVGFYAVGAYTYALLYQDRKSTR